MTGRQPPAKTTTPHVDHFRRRVVQDAFTEAMPAHWHRRSEEFARVGNERCDATAAVCEQHARFLRANPVELSELVAAELGELA